MFRLIIISIAIFLIALLLSGCYTLVGYPPDAKESMGKKHGEKVYKHYDYEYYESPYLWDGGYYLYDFFPYYYDTYSYWYRPWWHGGYYWDDGYHYYTPEKKPESQKRGTDAIPHSTSENRRQEKRSDNKTDSKEKQNSSEDDEKAPRRYR